MIYMVERVASGAIAASASWPYNVLGERIHNLPLRLSPSPKYGIGNSKSAAFDTPTSQSSPFLLVSNGVVLPAPRYVTR